MRCVCLRPTRLGFVQWDISNAFRQGQTFVEPSRPTVEPSREVRLDPPADVFTVLRDSDSSRNAVCKLMRFLRLLKGAYGLKVAPNLWSEYT